MLEIIWEAQLYSTYSLPPSLASPTLSSVPSPTYDIDYTKTFFSIVQLNSIRVILSLAVFIEQPLEYVVQEKSSKKEVSYYRTKSEYRIIVETVGEMMWFSSLFEDFDKVMSNVISTPHVVSSHQLMDIFTKSLAKISYDTTCINLDMFDLYVLV
ncbi:unnamed protein product [Spirodela intermedia]|uniref:Uncharacterized protein n=1 Tax=Spirodela intermedia TaxID=51605 RepID=A0A7I8JIK1_SPIIN|nr:unnamed protein product [Spirodela intermedia]CAA6669998.1 unnamed protein product [Spirodela intermedia]